MGWTYSTSWPTTTAMRDEIRAMLTRAGHTIVKDATTKYGRNYWAAVKSEGDGQTTIFHCLINGDKRDGQWSYGYKDMDESCGPCEVDCPLALLAVCSEPPNQWATEWRANVRAFHAARAAREALSKTVQLGAKVWLQHTKDNPFTIRRIEGRKILGTNCFGNGLYRIPRNRIEKVETADG